MKEVSSIEFYTGSKEEVLPGFSAEFPYIASCAELDKYLGRFVPWHWHKTVEIFYTMEGGVEYSTPRGNTVFPAGSGGMVNSNVLHMTKARADSERNSQYLHIFDPSFIAGDQGSRIEQKYVTPIVTAPQIEVIALYPDNPGHTQLLRTIRESFKISEDEFGYEIRLREALSDIWFQFLTLTLPLLDQKEEYNKQNDKIKSMMVYIHEHYAEKISIADIACAAFSSERECFRAFHDCLHMTPVQYIKSYRLQAACSMLAKTRETVTNISHACGMGGSSYFGKAFREHMGCTPMEYRDRWQNSDIYRQK